MPDTGAPRPIALVTGVGRTVGIGAAVATRLATQGWDLATSHWPAYEDRMPWGQRDADVDAIHARIREAGARSLAVSADLADARSPTELFDTVESGLGPVTALVLSHCESVNSSIRDTTVESFDRHYAVNVRASWLLIAEFARRFSTTPGAGRIIALTSDATAHNLPYGATKGALDRIVIAAARELSDLHITSNVINPGPVDTGWMSDQLKAEIVGSVPHGRLGTPADTAAIVSFLCSADGAWINGQLLYSDGGINA